MLLLMTLFWENKLARLNGTELILATDWIVGLIFINQPTAQFNIRVNSTNSRHVFFSSILTFQLMYEQCNLWLNWHEGLFVGFIWREKQNPSTTKAKLQMSTRISARQLSYIKLARLLVICCITHFMCHLQ